MKQRELSPKQAAQHIADILARQMEALEKNKDVRSAAPGQSTVGQRTRPGAPAGGAK